jgi:hypothetical protein
MNSLGLLQGQQDSQPGAAAAAAGFTDWGCMSSRGSLIEHEQQEHLQKQFLLHPQAISSCATAAPGKTVAEAVASAGLDLCWLPLTANMQAAVLLPPH